MIGLYLFLNHTFFGKAILATYADRQTAQLLSINVKIVDIVTFGMGTAIAGIAGLVVALTYSFSPSAIASWTVMGFAVAVIGGKGSVLGTLLAGIVLGIIEAAVSSVSANWIYLVAYSLLLLVFLVRPSGMLGERL
jgi:branched-chain amino acid transport system permease protein